MACRVSRSACNVQASDAECSTTCGLLDPAVQSVVATCTATLLKLLSGIMPGLCHVCRTVNIHLINTLGVEDVASCIECRCPPELELKNGGGVLCCMDCPSTSSRGVIEYAMEYTTIYRYGS